MKFPRLLLAGACFALPFTLIGCGTNDGPSLLVQKNVNGTYIFSKDGDSKSPTLFTAKLSSGDPVAPSGANYYSVVTGTITSGPGVDLSSCNGADIPVAGQITNPDHNNVYIKMTGTTTGSGTLTLDGSLLYIGYLGDRFGGTVTIAGGPCALPATSFVAVRTTAQ